MPFVWKEISLVELTGFEPDHWPSVQLRQIASADNPPPTPVFSVFATLIWPTP